MKLNIEHIKAKQAEVIQTMERLLQNIEQFDGRNREFIESVATQLNEDGLISGKQFHWMNKFATERLFEETAPLEGNFMATVAMMLIAGEKMKYPKMRFTLDDAGHEVALIFYPDRSKIYVTNAYAKSNWDRHWMYGIISSRDGAMKIKPGSDKRPEWETVRAFLEALSEDPQQCAKMSAARTGRCVYCNSELTDANSKVAGYGPTCAKNYDLPYRTEELVLSALELKLGL